MKNSILANAVKRAFQLNTIPVLIDRSGIADSRAIANYAVNSLGAGRKAKTFRLDTSKMTSRGDLIMDEVIDLGVVLGEFTVTRLPRVIEKAIDYAESHHSENPVLIFDHVDCGDTDVIDTIFLAAIHRHLGPIQMPCNLKVMIIVDDKSQLDAIEPAHRERFKACHVTAKERVLVVS